MKSIAEKIYNFLDNRFYFKIFYLFVSLTTVTIIKEIPHINIISKIALLWGMLLIIFTIFKDYRKRKLYNFDIILSIFIIVTFIFNVIFYKDISNIKAWVINAVLFMSVFSIDVFTEKKKIIREINIISIFYSIFMFVVSLVSAVLKFTDKYINIEKMYYGGTNGLFENKNSLSIAAAIAIVISLYLCTRNIKYKYKIFFEINILIQIVTLFYSKGRSAFLLLLTIVFTLIIVYSKQRIIKAVTVLVPFLIIVFTLININNLSIRYFTSGRSYIWESALIAIQKHPFVGIGNSSFVEAVRLARPQVTDLPGLDWGGIHNIYIQIALINGMIPLIIFMIFLITVFLFLVNKMSNLNKKAKFRSTILFSLVNGILVVNLFESNLIYIISFISIIFWIYLGYIISIMDNKNF
ncbi:O-antigen ligase family protein [Clostridium sp. BJN0001]|uniref:O-antigen ligase family protein n=1 Tax=Clostridium sp. BJN0001 TaxID=2930219 RepID=UPI001FCF9B0E|nr:O-antigen ligase family protein [Clostridium sp. BJN0001]